MMNKFYSILQDSVSNSPSLSPAVVHLLIVLSILLMMQEAVSHILHVSYNYFQGRKMKKEASKANFPLGLAFLIRKEMFSQRVLSTLSLTLLTAVETRKVGTWEKKIRFSCYGYKSHSLSRIISLLLERTE